MPVSALIKPGFCGVFQHLLAKKNANKRKEGANYCSLLLPNVTVDFMVCREVVCKEICSASLIIGGKPYSFFVGRQVLSVSARATQPDPQTSYLFNLRLQKI